MVSRRNLIIGGGIVCFVAGASFYRAQSGDFDGAVLTPEQAFEQAKNGTITLIDIRRPDEWERTGWGKPAKPLDMRRKDFVTELDNILKGDRSKPVALICAAGVRSAYMSNRLSEAGFTNIIDIPEGMLGSKAGPGWLRRGLPVTKS